MPAPAFTTGSTTSGFTVASGTSNWNTQSQSAGTGNNLGLLVISLVGWGTAPTSGSHTLSMTYGGVAMASVGRVYLNGDTGANSGFLSLHALGGQYGTCPSGTNTVAPQSVANQATEASYTVLAYSDVGSYGPLVTQSGTEAGTGFSLVVPSAINHVAVNGLAQESSTSISGFNKTSRGGTLTQVFISNRGATQDSAGADLVTFTATRASGVDHAEFGIDLIPAHGMLMMFR